VVMLTQTTIQGQNKTVGGTGSKGVNANLQFADSSEYDNNAGSALYFNITSQHGVAWANYFNSTLSGAGLKYGVGNDYTITKTLKSFPGNPSMNYFIVTVKILNVKVFDHTHANVNLNIGELSGA